MNETPPAKGPLPVSMVLAFLAPFVCPIIGVCIGWWEEGTGSFRTMFMMGYGVLGTIAGIVSGIVFAEGSRALRERASEAAWAALGLGIVLLPFTLVATAVFLLS